MGWIEIERGFFLNLFMNLLLPSVPSSSLRVSVVNLSLLSVMNFPFVVP